MKTNEIDCFCFALNLVHQNYVPAPNGVASDGSNKWIYWNKAR